MSILVTADHELDVLCRQTLAVHGNRAGLTGQKIADLFEAIRIAQHAAYAISYGDDLHLPAMRFPTSAPSEPINQRALKKLYEDLVNLGANTFDRNGHGWLPEGRARLLNAVRIRTATRAAGF